MVTNLEFGIGEGTWFPYCETCGISEPLGVLLGDITNVVEFFSGIVCMDIELGSAIGLSLEVITTILDTPKPTRMLVWKLKRNTDNSHIVTIESYTNFITHAVSSSPPLRDVVVPCAGDGVEVKHLDD